MKESKIQKKFSSKEEIENVSQKYCEIYPNLNPDHVKALTAKIIYLITNCFDPYYENWQHLRDARIMMEILIREFPPEERKRIGQYCLGVYFFIRGNENGISRCFIDKKLTPENPKDYQDLCKQITREQVTIITNYFVNSLSNVDKVLLDRADNHQDIENVQNGSFVSKVCSDKKLVSFVAGIADKKGNLRSKKPTHNSLQ